MRQEFIANLRKRMERFKNDLEPENIDKLNFYERGYSRGQLNLIEDIFEELEESKMDQQSRETVIKWPPDVNSIPCGGDQMAITECDHEYPNPWMGIQPPFCKKCGKQAKRLEVTCEE